MEETGWRERDEYGRERVVAACLCILVPSHQQLVCPICRGLENALSTHAPPNHGGPQST